MWVVDTITCARQRNILTKKEKNMLKRIPIAGEVLPHFDDGKITPSRLYEAKILKIIPIKEAKQLLLNGNIIGGVSEASLYDAWEQNKKEFEWIFADETDCFVCAEVKDEVSNPTYYARTKDGGWFSLVITNWLEGGELDSDMSMFNFWTEDEYGFLIGAYWENVERFKMAEK